MSPLETQQPAPPSFTSIVVSALRDSSDVLKKNAVPFIILSGVVIAVAVWIVSARRAVAGNDPAFSVIAAWNIAGIFAQAFAIRAAMKTHDPHFEFSLQTLLVGLLIAMGQSLITVTGLYLLIVPGIYFGSRFYLAYTTFLLGARNPYAASWRLTGTAFWNNLGLVASNFCIQIAAMLIAVYAAFAAVSFNSGYAVLAAPAVFWAYTWAFAFGQLSALRWALALQAATPLPDQ
jgi:hypothetical protein